MVKVSTITIRGFDFQTYIMEDKEFFKKHDCDSKTKAMTTIGRKNEIHFRFDELSLELTIHELVHAYYHGSLTETTEMSANDLEETFCEMFAYFGIEILRNARKLYKELRSKNAKRDSKKKA